ncbi:MAG: hypothetical protein F6K31_14080 [Symploca sp. SIO2G7]|nr:hypothetical protein [Symploca sp. SIO2G7]
MEKTKEKRKIVVPLPGAPVPHLPHLPQLPISPSPHLPISPSPRPVRPCDKKL